MAVAACRSAAIAGAGRDLPRQPAMEGDGKIDNLQELRGAISPRGRAGSMSAILPPERSFAVETSRFRRAFLASCFEPFWQVTFAFVASSSAPQDANCPARGIAAWLEQHE